MACALFFILDFFVPFRLPVSWHLREGRTVFKKDARTSTARLVSWKSTSTDCRFESSFRFPFGVSCLKVTGLKTRPAKIAVKYRFLFLCGSFKYEIGTIMVHPHGYLPPRDKRGVLRNTCVGMWIWNFTSHHVRSHSTVFLVWMSFLSLLFRLVRVKPILAKEDDNHENRFCLREGYFGESLTKLVVKRHVFRRDVTLAC